MRTLSPFFVLFAIAAPGFGQGASFKTFGKGCPGSVTGACPSNNASVTEIRTAVRVDNPRFALQVKATTPVIQGFEILTKSASRRTIAAWIYLPDSSGKPQSNPFATGSMTLDTKLGWYRATFPKPVVLGANTLYFLSWDAGPASGRNTSDPIAKIGVNSVHFESKAGGPWQGPSNKWPWVWKVLCSGSRMVPEIANLSEPYFGNTKFAVQLKNALPKAPAALILGGSNKAWNKIPLPLDLAGLGAQGCSLLVSVELLLANVADALGTASQPMPIPNDKQLRGVTFHLQWMVVDAGANALGLAFSNAATVVIGDAE